MTPAQCQIEKVGKARNGLARYWCLVHGANATGTGGTKLKECEKADSAIRLEECFEIDRDAYSGGVGVWGAVPPILNTAAEKIPSGVHVHARKGSSEGEKAVDETFPAVKITYNGDLFSKRAAIITQEAAVNYFISRCAGVPLTYLQCPHCEYLHLDAGVFATTPHRKHLCNGCGRHFSDDKKSVSNPIVLLRELLGDFDRDRRFEKGSRTLDIHQADYPGGIQIWASNPAILWKMPRAEHTGLHVHLFDANGTRVVDETFGEVAIDGQVIDESMARTLMAQMALPDLADKLDSLRCTHCGEDHFDIGVDAFAPHYRHHCTVCGEEFLSPRRKKLISNPLRRDLKKVVSLTKT